jgi:hypothetical protein
MKKSLTILFSVISLAVMSQSKVGYFRRFYIDDRQYQLRTLDSLDELTARLTNCYRVTFDDKNRILEAEYLKRNKPGFDNSGFAGLKIIYSNSMEKRLFLNPSKQPMKNSLGVYSIGLILNNKKVPVSLNNYDDRDEFAEDKNGVTIYDWTLNKDDWKVESVFKDKTGNRIVDKNGCFSVKYKWAQDDKAFTPEVSYYGKDGELQDGKRGYSIIRMRFDKVTENLLERRYLNSKYHLTLNSDSIAVIRIIYDKKAKLINKCLYDSSEQLINSTRRFCTTKYRLNKYGNVIESQCYNKLSGENYIEFRYKYDSSQRIIERASLKNGKTLVADNNGYATIRVNYNTFGEVIETTYFDVNNKQIKSDSQDLFSNI